MRYFMLILLSLFAMSGCTQQISQRNAEYKLVWQEDFNGRTIDTTSWSVIKRAPYSWSKYMSSHKSLYRVRNGYLRLYARRNKGLEPADTAQYLTGGVSTKGRRNVRLGKVEVRVRIKGAQGTWPAVWLLADGPVSTENVHYSEIDILEYLNRNDFVYQTVHSYYTLHTNTKAEHSTKAPIRTGNWNTYAAEIRENEVILSVNGEETYRYHRMEGEEGQFPYGIASYLMLDMQVGGTWVKTVDPKTFPAYMDIDWVKMYSLEQ
ncbi:MAG: glycoside hydrolase family 16 protein [Bacteroidaceae bacterium]|nr:glycoside hydrolase family 16 protein [Bacteroidaceae bacterium]